MAPKLVATSWNLAHNQEHWSVLASDPSIDIGLVQEAVPPTPGVVRGVVPDLAASWQTAGRQRRFCAAVAQMSDRVHFSPLAVTHLADADDGTFAVSRPGSIAAADVELDGERITLVSVYAAWESARGEKLTYADGSAHRLISDLSFLVHGQRGHRIIVAGDLNVYFGHGENGSKYWRDRYLSVFTRMEAIGLPFVGPQHPNGSRAEPWPPHLPAESQNVPTFRTKRTDPTSAMYQLDFVFASNDLRDRLVVTALNSVPDWGPSDHCRIRIELS